MKNWEDLDVKNKIAYATAIGAFIIGWGLTIAGFVLGAGVISDSVLWVLGQALVYAASILGAGMYIGAEVKHLKGEIKRFLRNPEEIQEIEEEL